MTDQELQNAREWRQTLERIIILLLAAVPNVLGWYQGYSNGTRLVRSETDRTRIEEKIDEQKVETRVAAEKAEVAVEHAKTAVEEVKTAAQETKTVIMELKQVVPKAEPPSPE